MTLGSPTVLVVDEDEVARARVAEGLRSHGHRVETAAETAAALRAVATHDFDVVLSGAGAAGRGGFALVREILDRQPRTVVVLAPTRDTVDEALAAMGEGADAPQRMSLPQLETLLRCVLDVGPLRLDAHGVAPGSNLSFVLESSNPELARAVAMARQVAPLDMTILLKGESGTGKSVLAAAIHRWSPRREGPFVSVACGLEERPRGGGERRAHGASADVAHDDREWIEAAARGTLFFDEVATLPSALQARLIRFLDEDQPDAFDDDRPASGRARVIAATNRDLETDVAAGRFRQDLFFRLNVIAIELPPLRQRRADLPALSERILAGLCTRHRREPAEITPEVRRAFAAYAWPGNLRELVTVLERATVLSREHLIRLDDLPEHVATAVR